MIEASVNFNLERVIAEQVDNQEDAARLALIALDRCAAILIDREKEAETLAQRRACKEAAGTIETLRRFVAENFRSVPWDRLPGTRLR